MENKKIIKYKKYLNSTKAFYKNIYFVNKYRKISNREFEKYFIKEFY